jgi:peptide/nickel transport system substrate-binding protein
MSLCLLLACCRSEGVARGGELPPDGGKTGAREIVVASYRDGAIDKLDAATYEGPHWLYKMIYEGLVEDGGDGKIIPALATGWKISDDARTYTFTLREGVKFSDGSDFDAEAVIFNMKRWINNDRHSSLSASRVRRIEATGSHEVEIEFENNSYPILTELTYPRPVRFLSPASLEGGTKFARPVGTGPWMVESYARDQEFTLVPNPHYRGERPKVDRLVFKVIVDAQARVLALRSGEIDVLGGDLVGKIPMESIHELIGSDQFKTYVVGTMCSHLIVFNAERVAAFKNRDVRLAMNYAIDKAAIAKHLFDDVGLEANGVYQRSVPYTTPENNYGFSNDKERARGLLQDAGYVDADGDGVRERDGERMEYTLLFSAEEFPEWKPLAEFAQAEFAAIGVRVNLKMLDKNGHEAATIDTKDYDLALRRTSSDSWMPHGSLRELFGASYSGCVWRDDWLDGKIFETLNTIDEAARRKNYDEVFRYISEQALVIPVYYPTTSFAVNEQKVRGFRVGVNNYAPVEWQSLDVAQ